MMLKLLQILLQKTYELMCHYFINPINEYLIYFFVMSNISICEIYIVNFIIFLAPLVIKSTCLWY